METLVFAYLFTSCFISHQEWPFSPHFIAHTTYMLSPQTLVTCKFSERLNLPVLILWTSWETGELHFPCSSLPTEWLTEAPDSELSERSQALSWALQAGRNSDFIAFLNVLLGFVPCKGWSLEDDQNAEGIKGAVWGQEVELGQGAWWALSWPHYASTLHYGLYSQDCLPPDPAPFCAQNLL